MKIIHLLFKKSSNKITFIPSNMNESLNISKSTNGRESFQSFYWILDCAVTKMFRVTILSVSVRFDYPRLWRYTAHLSCVDAVSARLLFTCTCVRTCTHSASIRASCRRIEGPTGTVVVTTLDICIYLFEMFKI